MIDIFGEEEKTVGTSSPVSWCWSSLTGSFLQTLIEQKAWKALEENLKFYMLGDLFLWQIDFD